MMRSLAPAAALLLAFAPGARAASTPGPRVLVLAGAAEREPLQAFVRQELEPRGLRVTFALPGAGDTVDLIVLAARGRSAAAEVSFVRAHLQAHRPLVALRAAAEPFATWPDFGLDVLGGRLDGVASNPAGPSVTHPPHLSAHPVLTGLGDRPFRGAGALYRFGKLGSGAHVLFDGITTDHGQIVTAPVAWTREAARTRVFYTSLGDPGDFAQGPFRRLLVNAIHWALDRPVPVDRAVASAVAARERFDLNVAATPEVAAAIKAFKGQGEVGDASTPTPAGEATGLFQVREGFTLDLVAAEPTITQPVHISFDERGRMWVVQYRQYPVPAGLKVVKYDEYLRAVFDKVPAPPPHHTPGADRVTVLEDRDGDGRWETVKDVITGLNIATSVAVGRGGIWVMNPPYLLFYPDRDGDDRPDGDPEVHLRGFGLEDTHAVANNLRWGPDGWLYGATGSTTTATVSSAVTRDVHFEGQAIWRYHPETRVFEVFAEGGGNTFSLDFDAKGRAFSGTNTSNTRGMHFVQGGYGVKNWGKHGPLTNPYAFGFFEHMRHQGYMERFPQAFLVYEGGSFPARYDHTFIAANALYNRVHVADLLPDTSSFRTRDFELLMITPDRWFRPVHLAPGPDGAIYVADWYDSRLTHVDPRDTWHKTSGRIYRVQATGARAQRAFDLGHEKSLALVDRLKNPNRWFREQARRVLADRKDASVRPVLRRMMAATGDGQLALEALWALNASGGFDERAALVALAHPDAHVRRWGVRLVGDARHASPREAARLVALARSEKDVEVRSQLASTAKRLPAPVALPMIERLLRHREDVDDLHLPLLDWWALEPKVVPDRAAVLALFADRGFWSEPMVERHILTRLARRLAAAGGHDDLVAAARLLDRAPTDAAVARLTEGLEQAFRGQPVAALPSELARAIAARGARGGQAALLLGLRLDDARARGAALATIADEHAADGTRVALIDVAGEVKTRGAVPVLLAAVRSPREPVRRAALTALGRYEDTDVARALIDLVREGRDPPLRTAALGALASRKAWARLLLDEVGADRVKRSAIAPDVVQKIALHHDATLDELVRKHWGLRRAAPAADKQKRMADIAALLRGGPGDVREGKGVFTRVCAPCHTLFGEGGKIGPELTGYERTNLDFMLLAIVDPSAGLREEYTSFVVATRDGRTLTGFVEDQNPRTVTLKGLDGQRIVLGRTEIESLAASPESVMPEGLMDALDVRQIKDLFAYLMAEAPPAAR